MHRMGETMSEQLHIEVKATVLQHVRFKYACRHCERTALHTPIVTAPMPAQPLPGSVATPSTLALVLANKYVDGTPLYRLEQALARANVSISRGALGNWVIRSVDLHLLRLYEALKQKLRSQPVIHGDETWVQVLKEDGRDAQAKSSCGSTAAAGTASSRLSCSTISPDVASSIRRPFWATTAAC